MAWSLQGAQLHLLLQHLGALPCCPCCLCAGLALQDASWLSERPAVQRQCGSVRCVLQGLSHMLLVGPSSSAPEVGRLLTSLTRHLEA